MMGAVQFNFIWLFVVIVLGILFLLSIVAIIAAVIAVAIVGTMICIMLITNARKKKAEALAIELANRVSVESVEDDIQDDENPEQTDAQAEDIKAE